MAIAPVDQPTLRALKRANVEKTLSGLSRFMKAASWLGNQNRYATNPVKTIASEIDAGRIQNPSQLSEYIAASCLLHCTDGWSYLGRAIWSLLKGDPHRARHLAYYAELRAATALLASEGVGVFNREHFAITAPSQASHLGTQTGTHKFAWDCLEFWAAEPASANLFARIIRPYGIALEDWCAPLGGATTIAPHAKKWFMQWGMDLRMLSDDHTARNISTYQPDGVPRIWSIDSPTVINFVKDLWESLEPAPSNRFDVIDRHILRITLERYFVGRHGKTAKKAGAKFRAFARSVVDSQSLSPEIADEWVKFISRDVNDLDLEIFKYSQKLPDDATNSVFAIMSRAALLLRAASGSTLVLFQAADHSIDSFKFWWAKFGIARALWDGHREANELQDLWTDIRDSITEIDEARKEIDRPDDTLFRLGEETPKALAMLGSCERVALWSMTN